jgi:hypothetical protein
MVVISVAALVFLTDWLTKVHSCAKKEVLGLNSDQDDDEFIDDSWSLTSRGSGMFCEICKVKMHKANFYRHLRTKLHIDNAAKYKGEPHNTQRCV